MQLQQGISYLGLVVDNEEKPTLCPYSVLSSLSIKTVNAKTFKNSYSIRIVEAVAHVVAGAVAASFAVDGDAASAIRPRVTASSAMCSKQSLA